MFNFVSTHHLLFPPLTRFFPYSLCLQFGPDIAIYFSFLSFYTRSLIPLTLFGLVFWLGSKGVYHHALNFIGMGLERWAGAGGPAGLGWGWEWSWVYALGVGIWGVAVTEVGDESAVRRGSILLARLISLCLVFPMLEEATALKERPLVLIRAASSHRSGLLNNANSPSNMAPTESPESTVSDLNTSPPFPPIQPVRSPLLLVKSLYHRLRTRRSCRES